MLIEELQRRGIPDFMPVVAEEWKAKKDEIMQLIQTEEYGTRPGEVSAHAENQKTDANYYGSKVTRFDADIVCPLESGTFTFPAAAFIPNKRNNLPAVVYISFCGEVPNKYMPAEELTDAGLAVFMFNYSDVAPDNISAFDCQLMKLVCHGERSDTAPGTISLWAWAASRVLDWALTFEAIDPARVFVAGHSRLGKTALLAAARDERFAVAYSNDSGCSGAAVTREKTGERIKQITANFPYWFCKRYASYAENESALPFEQDALLAMIAPRRVYVASAEDDAWADPKSEFLSCVSAGRVWNMLGKAGLRTRDRYPAANEPLHEGRIGYHMRPGSHSLTRDDWHYFIEYLKKQELM